MQILARNSWTRAYAPAKYCRYMPKMLPNRRGVVLSLAAALITQAALAQVEPLGTEYGISGPLAGDQVFPAAAINAPATRNWSPPNAANAASASRLCPPSGCPQNPEPHSTAGFQR